MSLLLFVASACCLPHSHHVLARRRRCLLRHSLLHLDCTEPLMPSLHRPCPVLRGEKESDEAVARERHGKGGLPTREGHQRGSAAGKQGCRAPPDTLERRRERGEPVRG
jgi:hypothetical protein